jgi:hypothetical protein
MNRWPLIAYAIGIPFALVWLWHKITHPRTPTLRREPPKLTIRGKVRRWKERQ